MHSETDVQNACVLAIEAAGGGVLRNNSGVAREIDETGRYRPVRYGLGNTSQRLNEVFKTGDLVGIYKGIFCMWECKKPGWKFSVGSVRERAQLAAIMWVRRHGGRAGFVTHPVEAVSLMMTGETYGS